jgi:16S rRNA (guanine966-N2)-methyltransferase
MKSALRILGGELRGRALDVAPGVRPSGARLREALFSIWMPRLAGARILDLYAGSGAIGLEAVSRGACAAVFVEPDRGARAALERNVRLAPAGTSRVVAARDRDALARLAGEGARFDLLFVDPPYADPVDASLLAALAAVAAPASSLVVEHRRGRLPPGDVDGWRVAGDRAYGDSGLRLYEASATG